MEVVQVWTGRLANQLRTALRLTNEAFARELGTAVRTVAKWNAEPDRVPVTELQRALDTMLRRSDPDVRTRFAQLVDEESIPTLPPATSTVAGPRAPLESEAIAASGLRLAHDPDLSEAFAWLDEGASWTAGTARRHVAEAVNKIDIGTIRDRAHVRARVTRAEMADALTAYYRPAGDLRTYGATCSGKTVTTTVLTRGEWLDACPLGSGRDRLKLVFNSELAASRLDEETASAAVNRLAEVVVSGAMMVNAPLYRLTRFDRPGANIDGDVALTDFVTYALTLDLLENELIDAVAAGEPLQLPLRTRYLPDLAAMTDLEARLCAGGPLALLAAARPARRGREPDYVLLVQERSGRTLNAGRRLAVIPKAFHQPLVDFSDDAQISATLEREMEEELFGRPDMDLTAGRGGERRADPLHITRLSPPMRWLVDHADTATWQMECTGFGINMVSGNFEFAGLIAVNDEAWWDQFGGSIEANWEAAGLRRYSTQDRDGLAQLVHDTSWSNEGLFAFAQGLRRLAEVGPDRVDLPPITVEV
jgi:hypothetical protein